MSASRIVQIILAGGLGGLLLGLAIAGLVAISNPHHLTAADLEARPEGQLVYPGAQLLRIDTHDETHPLIESPSQAAVIRFLATPDPIDSVVAWYDHQLQELGYTKLRSNPAEFASWRHGGSYFTLVYGRAAAAIARPQGMNALTAGFTVSPVGG